MRYCMNSDDAALAVALGFTPEHLAQLMAREGLSADEAILVLERESAPGGGSTDARDAAWSPGRAEG